jgi:N-acetylneuraminic acid mutarotase
MQAQAGVSSSRAHLSWSTPLTFLLASMLAVTLVLALPSDALCVTTSQIASATAAADSWLMLNMNAEGSWGAGVSKPRDTELALKELQFSDAFAWPGQTGVWALAMPVNNNDDLARRAVIKGIFGVGEPADEASMAAVQQEDGGFGLSAAYPSDVLDTQLALDALSYNGPAVAFIVSKQNADGGWGIVDDGASDVFMTAEVVRHLAHVRQWTLLEPTAVSALDRGIAWLQTRVGFDGSVGENLCDTAETQIALAAAGVSRDSSAAGNWLVTQQAEDGSFGTEDVRATALAAAALRTTSTNMQVADLTVSNANPRPGEIVQITATVANTGVSYVASGSLGFYDGPTGAVAPSSTREFTWFPEDYSTQYVFNYTVPQADSPITLSVKVDPTAQLAETDEDDNIAEVTIVPRGPVGTPELAAPQDGGNFTSTPMLRWAEPAENGSWLMADVVQIDRDPSFTSPSLQTTVCPLELGGTLLLAPAALADGTWYWRVRTWSDGEYSSWTQPRSFTLDCTAPRITRTDLAQGLISPNGDGVKDTARFAVHIAEDTTLDFSAIDASGVVRAITTTTTPLGRFVLDWDGAGAPADGSYRLKVVARDAAGNQSSATVGPVTVDRTAPNLASLTSSVSSFSPNADGYRDSVTLNWTGESGNTAIVKVRTATSTYRIEQVTDQSWTWDGKTVVSSVNAPDGNYSLSVQLMDSAGNLSQAMSETVMLKTIPGVGKIKIEPAVVTPGATATISVPVSDDSSVAVAIGGTRYQLVDGGGGTHSVSITASSAAGNYPISLVATDSGHNVLNTNDTALIVRSAEVSGTPWVTDTQEQFTRLGVRDEDRYTYRVVEGVTLDDRPGSLQLETHPWEVLGTMPYGRWGSANCLGPDGKIYCFGGWHSDTAFDMWEVRQVKNTTVYDPATGQWSELAPSPTPRVEARAICGADGKIYVIGGTDPAQTGEPSGPTCTTVERFDPATGIWETDTNHGGTLAPIPTSRGVFGIALSADGKIYCAGGYSGTTEEGESTTACEAYDPATNAWETKSPLPQKQCCFAQTGVDGKIYIMEGEYRHQGISIPSDVRPLASCWCYDSVQDTWTALADSPRARTDALSARAADGRIYVYGGLEDIYGDTGLTYSYDPATKDWARGSKMPTEIENSQGVADVLGRIYAFGGLNRAAYGEITHAEIQRLDPSYCATGTYVSPIRQSGAGWRSSWGAITWHGVIPTSTTMTLSTRTSDDAVTWSDWSDEYATSGSSVTSPPGKYIQFRVTMATSDGRYTPRLDDVSIVCNQSPSVPPFVYLATANSRRPLLKWLPSADPENDQMTYEVQVDASAAFDSGKTLSFEGIPHASASSILYTLPPNNGLEDGNYHYRVRASDGRSSSDWSKNASLMVDTVAPKLALTRWPEHPSIAGDGTNNLAVDYGTDESCVVEVRLAKSSGSGWKTVYSNALQSAVGATACWTWNGRDETTPYTSYVQGPGAYRLTTYATDGAGNQSVPVVDYFTIRALPVLHSIEPATVEGRTSLTVVAGGDTSHVTLTADGAARSLVATTSSGAYVGPVANAEPGHRLSLRQIRVVDALSGTSVQGPDAFLDTPGSFETSSLTVTSASQFASGALDTIAPLGGALTLPAPSWTLRPSTLAVARRDQSTVQVGSKVYMIGGYGSTDMWNTFEVFDLATGQGSLLPSPPRTHSLGVLAADDKGRIYWIGGSPDMKAVDRYDPSTNSWDAVASVPVNRHGGFAIGAGSTILVSGCDQAWDKTTVYALDTETGTWSTKASMPVGFSSASTAYLNGKCYCFGSCLTGGAWTPLLQIYDCASNSWTTTASPLPKGYSWTVDPLGDKLACVGLSGKSLLYDPKTNTSTPFDAFTGSITSPTHGVWDNAVYLLGGQGSSGYLNTVYRYQFERVGTYTSRAFDMGDGLTEWGRIGWTAYVPSTQATLTLVTRSSVDASSWSDWAPAASTGASITSPAGRYIQFKAELRSNRSDAAPVLGDVTIGLDRPMAGSPVYGISAPQPSSPVYDKVHESAPTLSWLNSTGGGPRSYEVQIDTNGGFTSPNMRDYWGIAETVDGTALYVPSTEPLIDGNWYWRVRATDGDVTSEWSEPVPFVVSTTPKLVIQCVDAPASIDAGDQATVRVTVANEGAWCRDPITVRLTSADAPELTLPDQTIRGLWFDSSETKDFMVDTAGHEGTMHLSATVDWNGSLVASDFDIEVLPSKLGVTVAPLLPAVAYSDEATFSATVENLADDNQSATLRMLLTDADGAVVDTLPAVAVDDLAPGETRAVVATWSPAGVYPGEYRVTASAAQDAAVRASANASFTVLPDVAVSARVGVDSIEYAAGEQVAVTSRVTNTSANAILSGATVQTRITDGSGAVLAQKDTDVDHLMQGDSRVSLFAWDSAYAAPGTYLAAETVVLADGTTAASSAETFTVTPTSQTGDGLVVAVDVAPSRVFWGDNATLSLSAMNDGNSEVSSVPVTFSVVDPATTGTVLWTASSTLSLAQSEATTIAVDCPTSELATTFANLGKDLLVIAQGEFADGAVTLGHVVLHVDPLALSAQLTADAASYNANDDVSLMLSASNDTTGFTLSGATAHVALSGPSGSVLETTLPVGSLDEHQSLSIDLPWNTHDWAPGVYVAQAKLVYGGQDFASADTGFEVASTAENGVGVSGSLSPSNADVKRGAPLAFEYAIANSGNVDLAELPLAVTLFDANGTSIVEQTATVSVAKSSITTGAAHFDTMSLLPLDASDAAAYSVKLTVMLPQVMPTLAHATATVEPPATPSVSIDPGSGSHTATFSATINAEDTGSGVGEIDYVLDGQSAVYGGPVTITGEGTHTVEYWATDAYGNPSTHKTATYFIDSLAPELSIAPVPGSYGASATVTLAAEDAGSGVAALEYSLDGAAVQAFSEPISITGDGEHTLSYWARDALGNETEHINATYHIDGRAPVSAISPMSGSAQRGSFLASIEASSPGSTVARIEYQLDGNASEVYSGAFMVAGEGAHTVEFWATDALGNVEPRQTATFVIDTTLPTVSLSPASGSSSGTVQVSIEATDSGSGVAEVHYAIDGAQQLYSSPFSVSGDGAHEVTAWATDAAGNTSEIARATYTIDTAAPTVEITPATGSTFDADFSASIAATDAGSGVAEIGYTLDGVSHVYTGPFAIAGNGTHLVTYWARDVLGNESAHASASYVIQSVQPGQGVDVSSQVATDAPRVLVLAQSKTETALAVRSLGSALCYHVTDSVCEFQKELRTGIYNEFVVLDPTTPLPYDLDRELAEQVFSGAVFIGSRGSGMDCFGKQDMMGLKYCGYTWPCSPQSLSVAASEYTPALSTTVSGKSRVVRLAGATALAYLGGNPAITYAPYGRGAAMYFTFDIASLDATSGSALLTAATNGLHPNLTTPGCGDVVAIQTTFTNKGTGAVDAAATGTVVNGGILSASSRRQDCFDRHGWWPCEPHDGDDEPWRYKRIHWCNAAFDSAFEPLWNPRGCGPTNWATPTSVSWQLHLASGESTKVVTLIRLPWKPGTMTFSTSAAPASGSAWEPVTDSVSASATGDSAQLFADAIAKVRAIPVSSRCDRMTRDRVVCDLQWLASWPPRLRAQYPCVIDELLWDACEVQGLDADTTSARLAIDELIRNYEARHTL